MTNKREIKFRAWDKFQAKMFNVQSIDLERGREKVRERISKKELLQYGLNSVELMQYTGLKDKNGVEIYEGDVVRHSGKIQSIVRYSNDDAGFKIFSKALGKLNPDLEFFSTAVEVIGNIYSNPELIK